MCFEYCYDQFDIQNETITYKCKKTNNSIEKNEIPDKVKQKHVYKDVDWIDDNDSEVFIR